MNPSAKINIKTKIFTILVLACFFLSLEMIQRLRHPQVGFRGMTNSLGFRSPEFQIQKEPGTRRILFIGSSTTFGVTGPVEKTFPYLVGEMLKEKIPNVPVQTINAAMPAKTSFWEVQRIRETLYLKPDILVVMTGYNDSATIYENFAGINERGDLILKSWYVQLDTFIAKRSVFYVTLREKIAIWLYGSPLFAFARPPDPQSELKKDKSEWLKNYPAYFRKNLEKMIEISRDNKIKLVFIKAPLGPQRRKERPLYEKAYLRLMQELDAVSAANQIPIIDLSRFFLGEDSRKYIGADGLHFTDDGNLAIAKAVSDFFLAKRSWISKFGS